MAKRGHGPGSKRAPKRSRTDLNELGIRAAKLHFEERMTMAEVQQAMALAGDEVRSARDARLLIERALNAGRVKVRVDVYGRDDTDLELARRLAEAAGLARAVVVDTGPPAEAHASDLLHRELARPAGALLYDAIRLCPDVAAARVGVGAGRGVAFTCDALRLIAPGKGYPGCEIYSLAGGVTRTAWADHPESVDADNNAGKLAAFLGAQPDDWYRIYSAKLPLFLPPEIRDSTVAAVCPHLHNRALLGELDVVLLGCGAVGPGHWLTSTPHPGTEAIKDEVSTIQYEILTHEEGRSALIDVGDYFMVGPVRDNELRKRAESVCDSLNARVVSTDPASLHQAKERIIVAGGAEKLPALRALISGAIGFKPTTLVTDTRSARTLLDELQKEPGPDPARNGSARQGRRKRAAPDA